MTVKISIKAQPSLDVELDMSVITFDDAIGLMKLQGAGDEESISEIKCVASKVAGVDVGALPILDAQSIIQAMMGAIQGDPVAEKN